ncbi:hypothetical protein GALMADRAFT_282846 [Galerina marginata CBS 339.88]|uniref:Glycerophosphocholine acyltransferase 1 n=1 Tax=Galerina marginata (strain CBS 339.88) TaxID=685588 RepID=A0A067SDI6_GALM3|nr:hypothetical protein GALMADRAFT_282846 [Galerina marginata CBS 339.88]
MAPESSPPASPPFSRGYFSAPFERFVRDESSDQLTGAFTLLDTVETYFDSHVDLLQRRLLKHSDRLKMKAEEAFRIRELKLRDLKIKDLSGDLLAENLEREIKSFKLKFSTRITSLSATWQSAKVIRTREKVSFFFGVMTLLFSALMFGMAPQWVHVAYTLIGSYLLPLRIYIYKKRDWHYFLFDLCYYVTILNFLFFWVFPSSPTLFVACYCLSHGSVASAVITWRNSLVFHDRDKVTTLFIHIYPPFSFTVIRHFYPNAEERFPALAAVPQLNPWRALLLSSVLYAIWQLLYWKFVFVNRRAKIESGQRTTSLTYLLNDKRGAIGRALAAIPPGRREASFMGGQFVYAMLTELPVVFFFYDSAAWSAGFLLLIFSVSVWNGGGFYIEVFGRKFERELEALRKEIAASAERAASASPASSPTSEPYRVGALALDLGAPSPASVSTDGDEGISALSLSDSDPESKKDS